MKGLVLAFFLLTTPIIVQAACTGDLPAQNPLHVYADGTSDTIVGGIGANQCGLEVTDFCANGRCMMFFDGLSGFIEVSALQSGSLGATLTAFEYGVTGIDGDLSFMGQRQRFQLTDGARLQVDLQADHVVLSLPAPLPSGIKMRSTGSSGWAAQLPGWVGVPVPVTIYLDRLSAPRATLELTADHQLLKMDMRLTLTRLGTAPDLATAPNQTPNETACQQTHALAVRVGESADQAQIDAFYAAAAQAGITQWDARSDAQCAALLAALAAAGIGARTEPQASVTPDICAPLAQALRPILRGPASAQKQETLRAMIGLGLTSLTSARPDQCAALSQALGR